MLIGLTLSLLIIAAATSAYGVSKQSWIAMTAADATLDADAVWEAMEHRGLADRDDSAERFDAATASAHPTREGLMSQEVV